MLGLAVFACIASAQQTVSFWSMWNDSEPQAEILKAAISEFESANPGVLVEVRWMGREVRNLVLPAIDSGQKVDVVEGDMSFFVQNDSQFLPLNDRVSAAGANGQALGDVLMPVLVALGENADGELMSVPHQPFVVAFFYNRDHFAAAGIDRAPATWEEFLAASEALKAAGYGPLTTDLDAYIDIFFGYYVERASGSCELMEAAVADRTGQTWRDAAFRDFGTAVNDLFAADYFVKSTRQNMFPAGQQMIALGEVTMYLNGSWLPAEVEGMTGPDFNWGTFSFPTVPGGAGKVTDVMTGAQGIAITRTSSAPDAAFALIAHILSAPVQERMVGAGFATANADVAWEGSTAEAGALLAAASQPLGWACDVGAGGELTANVVMPALTDLFVGKLTADAFVDRLADGSAAFWQGRR